MTTKDKWMIALSTVTIIVAIGSIITNICIERYNAGKNRVIYGIKMESFQENNKKEVGAFNDLLSKGEYAILYAEKMDVNGTYGDKYTYHLGKLKNE